MLAGEALRRFEAAQSLFDAPTHLLHIAECQALTGKLVEAQENRTPGKAQIHLSMLSRT